MVMWFNVEEARRHLLEKSMVYTLRPYRRKRENKPDVLMYDGFGKKGMVLPIFVKEIKDIGELKEYVTQSGFKTVEEWLKEAGMSRFLYEVKILWAKYELGGNYGANISN